ncbi:hypothetical protein ACFY4B_36190 [Kitasatospora sp. NPDC001261]|uniref:hypothetical protein n=1 Tax=Kitasatospora sp. NPDC001261 TaxID=3364012 RepID=UPI00368FCEB4
MQHANDFLYCVHDRGGDELYEWSVPAHIPDIDSRSGLDLTPYDGGLYCMHRF